MALFFVHIGAFLLIKLKIKKKILKKTNASRMAVFGSATGNILVFLFGLISFFFFFTATLKWHWTSMALYLLHLIL